MQTGNCLNKENVDDILNLTPMQEGMLFHYLSAPDSRQYYEYMTLQLEGEFSFSTARQAWDFVVSKNEALRTVFFWEKIEKPVQIILKNKQIPFREYDLSEVPAEVRKKQLEEIKRNIEDEKIDITNNPFGIIMFKLDKMLYELVICSHHIIFDGWSNGILIREFLESYESLASGFQPQILQKVKYKEFLNVIQKKDEYRQRLFWEEYLGGFSEKTCLPWGISKKENVIKEAGNYIYELPDDLSKKVKDFVMEEGITLATLFYSAWGILLQRYNNNQDIVFGTTVSGRIPEIQGIEDMVGLFINTLPLRVKTEVDEKVIDLIRKVSNNLNKRKEFECDSLTDIKNYSEISANESLFDSIMVFENYPLDGIAGRQFKGLCIKEYSIKEMTNFDLTVSVMLIDKIKLNFSYNNKNLDVGCIEKLSNHFRNILNEAVSYKNKKVSEIEMIDQSEKNRMLFEFNNTASSYLKDKTIHELFQERVKSMPDDIAVVFRDKKLTYRELNERSNQLARYLRRKGVSRNDIVGILLERSIEMIVSILGVIKSGGAYLPIDPEYPRNRIIFMLENSKAKILLSKESLRESIKYSGEIIEPDREEIYFESKSDVDNINSAENLLYVIYTSGSTGNPKGVMLTHRSVNNFIKGITEEIDFSISKSIISVTTISFDIFVLESILPLTQGLKVVIADKEEQITPRLLNDCILRNNVQMIQTTPSRMQMLLVEENLSCFNNLTEIMIGGEAFPQQVLSALNSISSAKIYNMYGPTETTVWSALKEVTGDTEISIGKPIANTTIYILDDFLNLVPVGIEGELYIGGDGLAKGYFDNDALTAERFIDNPFVPGEKMYRTGDLARWLEDGNIDCLGRVDSQVKLRGFRIELGEIESQLLKHKDIKEAAVVLIGESINEKYICAYLVAYNGLHIDEIRSYMESNLPYYMVPSAFVFIDKLPMTPNGKIDRKKLPSPDKLSLETQEYIAPNGEIQESLANIWSEILKLEREKISVNDRFFDIGGNSLLLIRVQSKLEKLYPGKVTVPDLFSYTTISKLSDFIQSSSEDANKELPYKLVNFPMDYFVENAIKGEAAVFKFDMEDELYCNLKSIALSEKTEVQYILLSLFIYLISEISGTKEIAVQVIKEGGEGIASVHINIELIKDFSELFREVEKNYGTKDCMYKMEDIVRKKLFKAATEIIPLFYQCKSANLSEEINSVFDISLGMQSEAEILNFIFRYNYKRIKKDKAIELVNNYMDLIETYIDRYKK